MRYTRKTDHHHSTLNRLISEEVNTDQYPISIKSHVLNKTHQSPVTTSHLFVEVVLKYWKQECYIISSMLINYNNSCINHFASYIHIRICLQGKASIKQENATNNINKSWFGTDYPISKVQESSMKILHSK